MSVPVDLWPWANTGATHVTLRYVWIGNGPKFSEVAFPDEAPCTALSCVWVDGIPVAPAGALVPAWLAHNPQLTTFWVNGAGAGEFDRSSEQGKARIAMIKEKVPGIGVSSV